MYLITGATGHLGQIVVNQLRERVPVAQIAAMVRNADKAAPLAAVGIDVRIAAYSDAVAVRKALTGIHSLLLISSSEMGQRVAQHRNIIDAAKQAGVRHIVYTSLLHAPTSKMQLAVEHRQTEDMIVNSGIPYTLLRNGFYIENYTENLTTALQHGVIFGSAQSGKISAASRADFAAAAVVALTQDKARHIAYELAGDHSFTMAALAQLVTEISGKPVAYKNLPPNDYAKALTDFGLPREVAQMLADSDQWAADGALEDNGGALQRLIGRATTPLRDLVKHTLGKK